MAYNEINRRAFLLAGAGALVPGTGNAQTNTYTIDDYPYKPDGTEARIGHRVINMDLGLLHPNDGAPTIGFYASLDHSHGAPFGENWKATFRKFFKGQDVHSKDKGTIILIANHIRAHGVPVEQLTKAYNDAKAAWDANPNLRLAGVQDKKDNIHIAADASKLGLG